MFVHTYRTESSNILLQSRASIGVAERRRLLYEAQQDDQPKVLDELLATYGLILQGRITLNPESGESGYLFDSVRLCEMARSRCYSFARTHGSEYLRRLNWNILRDWSG